MEVTLRRFDLSDVDAMMSWASDPQVAAFCRWEPYSSTESLLAYLRDTVLPHPWFRAICLGSGNGAGDDRPVGLVSLAPSPEERCRGELGYVVARAHWGKGVATAAVKRALAAVFGEVEGLARVEALVDVDNAASQRVAEKAGFRREGVLRRHYWHKGRARDLVMYSFVLDEACAEEGSEMEERGARAGTPECGEKVALRPFHLGDFDDAEMTWASDPVPAAPMPRAWDPCPSRESLLAFLWLWDSPLRRPWVRAICLGAGVVGAVAVTRTDDWCRAEIGAVLARAHSSVAVAAAAMRRAVAAVFGDGGLEGVERVEAVVHAGGGGGDGDLSRRALEEAGFRREAVLRSYRAVEGRLRDMAIYSFISTDPLLD